MTEKEKGVEDEEILDFYACPGHRGGGLGAGH
jgi:hypothetical protein